MDIATRLEEVKLLMVKRLVKLTKAGAKAITVLQSCQGSLETLQKTIKSRTKRKRKKR